MQSADDEDPESKAAKQRKQKEAAAADQGAGANTVIVQVSVGSCLHSVTRNVPKAVARWGWACFAMTPEVGALGLGAWGICHHVLLEPVVPDGPYCLVYCSLYCLPRAGRVPEELRAHGEVQCDVRVGVQLQGDGRRRPPRCRFDCIHSKDAYRIII